MILGLYYLMSKLNRVIEFPILTTNSKKYKIGSSKEKNRGHPSGLTCQDKKHPRPQFY